MMKDYIRWPLVAGTMIVLVVLFHMAKQLDLHEVRRVYDGDTIELDDGRKIRLIGVDAPEVESPYSKAEKYGQASKKHLRKLLNQKKVYIKVGPTTYDKYGRTLAYVYADDVLINGRMIRDGWAQAYIRFNYKYKDLFVAYEKEARAKGIGMWQDE